MKLKQIDAESKILKLMMTKSKSYAYIITRFKNNYFASKEHRIIFSLLHRYFIKHDRLATYKVLMGKLEELKVEKLNRYKLIFKRILSNDIKMRELPYYTSEIIKAYKSRRFLVSIYNANQQAGNGNIKTAINTLHSTLTDLQQEGEEGIIREGGYLDSIKQRGRELINKNFYFGNYMGVPSGLRVFDKCYGGVYPGELGVIVGGTGKGKSILLLNFVVNAAKLKLPVVIVTIEMSKMQYEYRLDSRLSTIEANKFRKKELTKDEIRLWIKKMKRFRKCGKVYIIDIPEGANTHLIEMKLKEAERYLKTTKYLLVVDYLNLMIPNRFVSGGKNDHQVLGEISENLKQLARKKHIPIWTCAQLSKQGAKKNTLSAEDVGYAYKIAQDADFGLGLIQTDEMEEEGILQIVCMKGREGKFPAINCYPDFKRMRINDRDANGEGNE